MFRTCLASLIIVCLAAAAPAQNSAFPGLKPYKGTLDKTGAIESPGFESPTFTIACWVPSFYDLEKWSKRGINVACVAPKTGMITTNATVESTRTQRSPARAATRARTSSASTNTMPVSMWSGSSVSA